MLKQSTEELYLKSEELFTSIPREEVIQWCGHPITKSLIHALYGDMAGHFEGWANGEFTGESTDETIQKNSKALGSVGAIESILTWIDDAKKGEMYD